MLPLFRIWTPDELVQAASTLTRASQARWCTVAVVFVLWRWGLKNRMDSLNTIVDREWPELVQTMAMMDITVPDGPVTPAALCQVRQQVGRAPFDYLQTIATERHMERHEALIGHRGYRLYAVDGSSLKLHANETLTEAFGRPSSSGKNKAHPQATFTVLELVNTGWIVDYRLEKYDAAELAQAKSLTMRLGMGDLLLADRLYFDPAWYRELCERHVAFFFRLNRDRYKSFTAKSQQRIAEQRQRGGNVDCRVDLRINTGKSGTVLRNLRYIEIPRSTTRHPLCFITTLTGDELPTECAADFYRMRWENETVLRFYKGQDHLLHVRSRRPDTVAQEVCLHVLAYNSVRFIQSEACLAQQSRESPDEPEPESPHMEQPEPAGKPTEKWTAKENLHAGSARPVDLQFNRTVNLIIGTLLAVLLSRGKNADTQWEQLLQRISSLRVMAKPGRSYPRQGRKYNKGKRKKGNVKAQKKRAAKRRRKAEKALGVET